MIKTLIFNGSPRKNGDTAAMIKCLTERLHGEYKIVDTYYCSIKPCVDCRFCRENKGCRINDDMQQVYRFTEECDNILIASPIYFSELTGSMLSILSRFQTYFCARHFRGEEPIAKKKKGAVLLAGGGNGNSDTAVKTAGILLRQMGANEIFPAVCSHHTDNIPAINDENTIKGICKIAEFFNGNAVSED